MAGGTSHSRIASNARSLARQRAHATRSHAPRLLSVIVTTLLAGCAVGPEFVPPPAPDVSGYERGRTPTTTVSANVAGGAAQRLISGRDIPGEWWQLFRSPPLKSLMEDALTNNHDLKAAQAALHVARENAAAGRGAFFPSIDGGFTATRQKVPADFFGQRPDPEIFNVYTGQVSVSYTPDVFGLTRRTVESLEAQTDNQRFQLEATFLT